MVECVFATGLPSAGKDGLPQSLRELAHILPITAGIRSLGAAALDLAYVAAGRFDGFWERSLKLPEMSAGSIILKEA
jgi:myo-inositol-1(or 4)-monophosphatase